MIDVNEAVTFLLGLGILVFILSNRQELQRSYNGNLLMASFSLLLAGWLLTILEGFFLKDYLNLLEHACYAASSVLMAWWCLKTKRPTEESG